MGTFIAGFIIAVICTYVYDNQVLQKKNAEKLRRIAWDNYLFIKENIRNDFKNILARKALKRIADPCDMSLEAWKKAKWCAVLLEDIKDENALFEKKILIREKELNGVIGFDWNKIKNLEKELLLETNSLTNILLKIFRSVNYGENKDIITSDDIKNINSIILKIK